MADCTTQHTHPTLVGPLLDATIDLQAHHLGHNGLALEVSLRRIGELQRAYDIKDSAQGITVGVVRSRSPVEWSQRMKDTSHSIGSEHKPLRKAILYQQ